VAASANKGSTVTSVLAILARASAAGVILEAYGDRIRFNAPYGLPDDLRADLVAHKPEVLALLARPRGPSSERVESGCDPPAVVADPRHSGPPVRRVGRPGWDELSRQRWGLALDDDEPGIVVDAPDPARRRAALEAVAALGSDAAEGPGSSGRPRRPRSPRLHRGRLPGLGRRPDGVRRVVRRPRRGRRAGPRPSLRLRVAPRPPQIPVR